MGIFNQHSINQPQQGFLRRLQGSPGVGFNLTKDGNYDMLNKKLKNVGEDVESGDAITKHQLEVSLNTRLDKTSLSNYVKKNSPEVGADLDMKGFAIKNMKVTPGNHAGATSKKNVDRKIGTKADKTSFASYVKKNSPEVAADLDMKGFAIKNMKVTPGNDASATSRKYVDGKLNTKADKNDLNGYLKLDETSQMQGNLEMNNNQITRLPDPHLGDEAATKNYVLTTMNHLPNLSLDRQGTSKMLGNLQMNNHRITGLTNPPNDDDEAVSKKYVDENISKSSSIKPSHTPKNVFQYLMDDVNEWTTEYGVKVGVINDLAESPHSWDKKVLNISPVKNGRNCRFRVGLQMFRMKTNEQYSLIVELYNRDYTTWERQQTYVNGTGMWVESNNTTKYQYHYLSSNTLYYSKTLIRFKKTSSSPPLFVYFTVHFDDKDGDLNTYPSEYKNQLYMVAYGVEGLQDHVDSEVYDAHQAFEIDKTKMKMLVPLDMNNQKIMNTNYDLKFGETFEIEKCFILNDPPPSQNVYKLLRQTINNGRFIPVSFSVPVVLHSIILPKIINQRHNKTFIEISERVSNKILRINIKNDNPTMFRIFKDGINHIHFYNTGNSQFDVDIVISYM